MVAMETMHFFIVQLCLRTKILCISGVPMNDLAPMKNCPGGGGCKVGQISSRGIRLLAEKGPAPPLGNFADIVYLKEKSFLIQMRDVCTLYAGA